MNVKGSPIRVTMDSLITRSFIFIFILRSQIYTGDCKCIQKSIGTVVECTDTFPDTVSSIPSSDVINLDIHDAKTLPSFRLHPSYFREYSNLHHVQTIRIHRTALVAVDKNAFKGLRYLVYLDISDNHILKTFHPEAISQIEDLKTLILKGNIRLFKHISGPILISESLEELDLSGCEIESLTNDIFDQLKQLTFINLAHNKIRKIPASTFSGLQNLMELDLSNNLLSSLPWYMLRNSSVIQSLILHGNPISDIPKDIFPDTWNAELMLDLGETELTAIKIPPLVLLTHLDLGGSQVASIENLSDFPELKHLNLSHSKIARIESDSFDKNHKLETILLSGIPSLSLPAQFNGSFSSLYLMDISNCGLVKLMPNLFKEMTEIATLNLSRNALSDSESLGRALSSLRNLLLLDLSYNHLRVIGDEDFSGNNLLKKLWLTGNPFVSLPSFTYTPSLVLLDLSHCSFTRLHLPDIFKQGESLQYLSLAGNNLTSVIDEEHMDQITTWKFPPSLTVLDLRDNLWSCDPSFIMLIDEAIRREIEPSSEPPQHTEPSGGIGREIGQEWKWLRQEVCEEAHNEVEITLKPLNLPPPVLEGIVTAKFPIWLGMSILVAFILGIVILTIILYHRYNRDPHQDKGLLSQAKPINVSLVGSAGALKISSRNKDYQRLKEDRSPNSPTTPRIYKPPQKGVHFTFPEIPDGKESEN